jgi:hypothetical protein
MMLNPVMQNKKTHESPALRSTGSCSDVRFQVSKKLRKALYIPIWASEIKTMPAMMGMMIWVMKMSQ